MRQFRYISSIGFAFLVLFASTNFMVGIHLCGGEIQHVALFGKAEGCKNEKKVPPCHRQESTPCCQNETIVHDAQAFKGDATQISISATTTIDHSQPHVLVAEVIPTFANSYSRYYNYDPPLRSSDLTVALHVFLI